MPGLLRLERLVVSALMRVPSAWIVRAAGGPRRVDGKTLDPQLQLGLALHTLARRPALETLTPVEARAELDRSFGLFASAPRTMSRVRHLRAPGPGGSIPIRLYEPLGVRAPAPLIVFYHGGGGVVGSVDTVDPSCRMLAEGAQCWVASVEYRLAPEHPFPAGLEDARAAYRWLAREASALGADPARIAVAGDSMGGNLATGVARRARTLGDPPPCAQLLLYPWVDLTRASPSVRTFGDGYGLTAPMLEWFAGHYVADAEQAIEPDASPLFATDLAGCPPALVVTAGFDPLVDEGRAYADALAAAGVAVRHRDYPSLIHGFINVTGAVDGARRALREVAGELRGLLAG